MVEYHHSKTMLLPRYLVPSMGRRFTMRYTYHWTENGILYKKTVRSFRGKILYKVQEKKNDTDKYRLSKQWEESLGYGRTWFFMDWVVADNKDLDLGIWGV